MKKEDAIRILERQRDRFNRETISNYTLLSQTNDYLRQFLPPNATQLRLYHDKYLPLQTTNETEINIYLSEIREFLNNCIQYVKDVGVTGEIGLIRQEYELKKLRSELSFFTDPKYIAGFITGLLPLIYKVVEHWLR